MVRVDADTSAFRNNCVLVAHPSRPCHLPCQGKTVAPHVCTQENVLMWKFAQLDLLRRLDQSVSSVTDTFRRLGKTVGDFPRAVHKTVCPVCQIHTALLTCSPCSLLSNSGEGITSPDGQRFPDVKRQVLDITVPRFNLYHCVYW